MQSHFEADLVDGELQCRAEKGGQAWAEQLRSVLVDGTLFKAILSMQWVLIPFGRGHTVLKLGWGQWDFVTTLEIVCFL